MTNVTTTDPPDTESSTPSTAERAKGAATDTAQAATEQAKGVAQTATSEAQHVAQAAKDQLTTVTGEARQQAQQVLSTTTDQLEQQLEDRLRAVTEQARTTAAELLALREGRPGDAPQLARVAEHAEQRIGDWADRAESLGVRGVANEVSDFARRRPFAFLAGAALAGVAVGRLARAGREVASGDSDTSSSPPTAGEVPVIRPMTTGAVPLQVPTDSLADAATVGAMGSGLESMP